MQTVRSPEYSKLVLDIFLIDVEAIEAELKRLGGVGEDSDEVFVADVSYGEYYFLLMTERDFKVSCMGQTSSLVDEINETITG